MKDLLKPHIGTEIGINIIKPLHIDPVKLTGVNDEYFTVENEKDGNTYHVPYLNIVKIIENPDGVTVSGLFKQHKSYPFIVKVGHIVEHIQA